MQHGTVRTLTDYRNWLGAATGLFAVWYVVFLFPHRTIAVVSSLAAVAHGVLPVVPAVRDEALRATVGAVVTLGLPLTIIVLVVGFGLFHRQAESARRES